MAQSPEYPDLPWVPPRSWTNANRDRVQLIVIHTTEGSAHGRSAEDGAAYDARRTDGTSTHYFHDCDTTVQCVRTEDRSHTARSQGNRRGIHHELCTRAGSASWGDAYHQAMLRRAARQAARDARKWGIPVRHLTAAQVAAGEKGFCGHWDITRAFPQDGGTHTDPGQNFPWSQFLDMVRAELAPKPLPVREDVMTQPTAEQIADANWDEDIDTSAGTYSARGALWVTLGRTAALTGPNGLPANVAALKAKLDDLVAADDVEFDALAASLVLINAKLDLLLAGPADPAGPAERAVSAN